MKNPRSRINARLAGAVLIAVLGFITSPVRADDGGAALYKTKCAACHGADAKGETTFGKANKLRDLSSADVRQQSDAELTATVTSGKGKMPGYGKSLKLEQIKDLVTYIRSLAKE